MEVSAVRVLVDADRAAIEAFLLRHADSSMFLHAHARARGLDDRGQPYQATYAAAFEDGQIAAVAAHTWMGMLLVQAPAHVEHVVRTAVARSRRRVAGINGPWSQVVAARAALDLDQAPALLDSHEILYALELARLMVPEALADGRLRCRRLRPDEIDRVAEWRVAYAREMRSRPDTPALPITSRQETERLQAQGLGYVLVDAADEPLAFSAFNAMLPDAVQVGGVWTPLAWRRRGYARAVVAGSLLQARAQGVTRGVLFTAQANRPAQRAYEALGFRVVGDYGLLGFAEAQRVTVVP
jgi:predicted GNAT family acetyltransferase